MTTCLLAESRIREFRELLETYPGHRPDFYVDLAGIKWATLLELYRQGFIQVDFDHDGLYTAGDWVR